MKVLRIVPLVLIIIGAVGMIVTSYKRNQLLEAILVVRWCQSEQAVMKSETGGIACAACAAYTKEVSGDIKPLLEFYQSHQDYDPFKKKMTNLDFSPETQATVTTAYRMGFEAGLRACVDLAKQKRSKKMAQAIKDRYSSFFEDESAGPK